MCLMLKYILLFICACLLFTACTPISNNPSAPPSEVNTVSPSPESTSRNMTPASYTHVIWNGTAFTKEGIVVDLTTGESFSACNDPLCTNHTDSTCAVNILKSVSDFAVSPSSTQSDLIMYIARVQHVVTGNEKDQEYQAMANHQILRYHYYTGALEILRENLLRTVGSFAIDPLTEDIYYTTYVVDKNGDQQLAFCILNGITGKNRIVTTTSHEYSPMYARENILYCRGVDMFYRIDLSKAEPVFEPTGYQGNRIVDGYLYYMENIGSERVYAPDNIIAVSEEYGVPAYADYDFFNLYRKDITKEDAQPELIAEHVASGSAASNCIWYLEAEPRYHTSFFWSDSRNSTGGQNAYSLDDPNVPVGARLLHAFSEHDSTLHVLDANTLEPITVIDLEQYYLFGIIPSLQSEGIVAQFYGHSLEDYLDGKGFPKSFTGFIPFSKNILTDEDIIPMTPD